MNSFMSKKEEDIDYKHDMVKPKTAYIEIKGPIDDFYSEWEDMEEGIEPTQEDYDNWLLSTAMGFFQYHKHELDNYLKLK